MFGNSPKENQIPAEHIPFLLSSEFHGMDFPHLHHQLPRRQRDWKGDRQKVGPLRPGFSGDLSHGDFSLVGGFNPSEKYDFVTWDYYSQYMEK